MKKTALFLVMALAVIAFGSGTARADRGFWFHSTSAGWTTYINITNEDTVARAATVTFYPISTSTTGTAITALGSTTMTIQPGGQWNFTTAAIGVTALSTGALETAVRGTVVITGASAGKIHGHTTQANATFSGFDLTIDTGGHTAE